MWPFRRRAEFPELEDRLNRLERQLEDSRDELRAKLRSLDADMDDLYGKVKRALGRVNKAEARATDPEAPAAPATDWQSVILSRRANGLPNRG